MNRIFLGFLVVAAFAITVAAQSRFQSADVDTALSFVGMRESDFVSDRIWAEDDTFLLPKIREALSSPIAAYRVTHEYADATPQSVADAGQVNAMNAFSDARCPDSICHSIESALAFAPKEDPFEPLLTAIKLTETYRVQAFSRLSVAQQQAILLAMPLWFQNKEISAQDSLKGCIQRAFGIRADTSQKVNGDSVLTLMSMMDRKALAAATYAFARGIALTVQQWKMPSAPKKPILVPGVEGTVLAVRQTAFGTFVIGGPGANAYSGDFVVIIDAGGNDRYLTRTGSAVGILGHSESVAIDFGGDDLYLLNQSCDQGCGILGFGALVDLGGNDIYQAASFSQAAAFCGAALLFDSGGDDTYRAQMFGQGAAVCGLALLCDGSGRDLYDLGEYGQAFAGTFAVAALVDRSGNDVYRAGGIENDLPLRPEDYNSYAQGFATGWRPRGGGGIAVLHDVSGNDHYEAEIYGQGVGYWYSLGSLIDDSGADVYNATQYCQGAGIHLAAGVLDDGAGDDRYGSRFGPGEGAAHDLAVGFLWDHSGDDQYTISGGQGMAINNSAALFLDGNGNDDYNVTERDLSEGGTREARGFGNLGVFVDAIGHDTYSDPGKSDSAVWFQSVYGIGYDVPRDSIRPREAPVNVTLVPADTQRTIEQIFHDASLWEVSDYRERVRRGRLALEAKWQEAIPWVAAHKLNTVDGLERRAIVDLYKAHPDTAAPYLLTALNTTDQGARRTAITTFAEMKYRGAVGALIAKLPDSSFAFLRPTILSALGEIGDTAATETALAYVHSPSERERIAANVCLGKLADPRGYAAMLQGLEDTLYTVRSAAIIALGLQSPKIIQSFTSVRTTNPEGLMLSIGRMGERWSGVDSLKNDVRRLAPIVRSHTRTSDPRTQAAAVYAASFVFEKPERAALAKQLADATNLAVQARLKQLERTLR